MSKRNHVPHGVPQGGIFGPLLSVSLGCISLSSRVVSLHAGDAERLLMPRLCPAFIGRRARCGNRFPGDGDTASAVRAPVGQQDADPDVSVRPASLWSSPLQDLWCQASGNSRGRPPAFPSGARRHGAGVCVHSSCELLIDAITRGKNSIKHLNK